MAKGKKETLSLEELLEQAIVKEEDRPYEVPENWVWVKFGFLADNMADGPFGSDLKKEHYTENKEVRIIQLSNIGENGWRGENKKYTTYEHAKTISRSMVKSGEIVIAKMMPAGRAIKVPNEEKAYILSSDAVKFVPKRMLNTDYLLYAINSDVFRNQVLSETQGITRARTSIGKIKTYALPFPPFAEQQSIVKVIESLFEKLDTAKDLVQNALDSFESSKAAILHKAFTGELTARWRDENVTDSNNLLRDILAYYTELGIKKYSSTIIEHQSEVTEIKSIENSLWYKCLIGAVSVVSNGSTPSRQKPEYWNGAIPWVSSGEVRNNLIETTKETITQEGYDNSSVKILPAGTVLIAMIGEGKTRGQSAILNIEATINQNIAAIDISHKKVDPKFMWYWLQKQYESNREKGNGTGPQALNCQRVRELDFILPPLPEQREIVRNLNNLLENEQRAKELSEVIEKIELMKKAILARAFRGELGTNNPEEESAVEMLKVVLIDKV